MTEDERYMKEALRQARKAEALEEVPIGCVIVREGKIIARGYNRRNTDKNTLSHAELNAIRRASKKTGDWRLEDCTSPGGTRGARSDESKGGLCRIGSESFGASSV